MIKNIIIILLFINFIIVNIYSKNLIEENFVTEQNNIIINDGFTIGDVAYPGEEGERFARSTYGNDVIDKVLESKGIKSLLNNKERDLAVVKNYAWKTKTVKYAFSPEVYELSIDFSQKAMWEWTSQTCLVYRPVPFKDERINGVLVIINPAPNKTDTFSCFSTIGQNKIGSYMGLTYQCEYGSVVHEFGHTNGLLHEQSRNDRDSKVHVISYREIDDLETGNWSTQYYTILESAANWEYEGSPAFEWIGPLTPYEFESNMAYHAFSAASNNNTRVQVYWSKEHKWLPLGNRFGSTLLDAAGVNQAQQCGATISTNGLIARNMPYGKEYILGPNRRCALFYRKSGEKCIWSTLLEQWDNLNEPPMCRNKNLMYGAKGYCTKSCPCEAGEGQCASNAECVTGTFCDKTNTCRFNVISKPNPGAKCSVNVDCTSLSCVDSKCSSTIDEGRNCGKVDDKGTCIECALGYIKSRDGHCYLKNGEKCMKQYSGESECANISCKTRCCSIESNPNCITCGMKGECLLCETGYNNQLGKCMKK